MSLTNDTARPDLVRVVVHQVTDRRGRRTFVVTIAGRSVCTSCNPIVCSAEHLLEAGHDPSTPIRFCDAATGIEEVIVLSKAAEWQMPGTGTVLPFRKPTPRPKGPPGGDAA